MPGTNRGTHHGLNPYRKTPAFRLAMHDDNAVQQLKPGQTSYPYDRGFLVPVDQRDDVNLQVNVALGSHQPALFTGPLDGDRD